MTLLMTTADALLMTLLVTQLTPAYDTADTASLCCSSNLLGKDQPSKPCVSHACSAVKGRATLVAADLHIGSELNQQLCRARMFPCQSYAERSDTLIVLQTFSTRLSIATALFDTQPALPTHCLLTINTARTLSAHI